MSKYALKDFPDSSALLFDHQSEKTRQVVHVNAHIHTPFSYSYFNSISELFLEALKQDVRVLGINDFFMADGFKAFYNEALQHKVFPMFNIEIVGLMVKEQYDRFRINDPVNPGRVYLSGKGLDYPFHLDEGLACRLHSTRNENQQHTKEIIEKANRVLGSLNTELKLKYSEIRRIYAREFVTERHVSRAIREMIYEHYPSEGQRVEMLTSLMNVKQLDYEVEDHAGIENEIRGRFLKSGGPAFVPEEQSAFLPVSEVISIIRNAGGIPCYSVLLDDDQGRCTEYEANKQILLNELLAYNIHCIEFIPTRNHPEILRDYVRFFRDQGFLILFGTAHSTPEEKPLRVCTRDGEFLDEELAEVSYEGAGIIAAHQYLRAKGETGYLNEDGSCRRERSDEFISLGKSVIHRFINS